MVSLSCPTANTHTWPAAPPARRPPAFVNDMALSNEGIVKQQVRTHHYAAHLTVR